MPPSESRADETSEATIRLIVEGGEMHCRPGQSVAGVLLSHRLYHFRRSPNAGAPRGPFCMMGACQECAIRIDGGIRLACQTEVADGMRIDLQGAGAAEDKAEAGRHGR